VEVSYKPPHALDILRWPPFILLNTISLPMYEGLEFPSEDPTVQDLFYFIFFNSVADYWGRWVTLYSFVDGVCIVGPKQGD